MIGKKSYFIIPFTIRPDEVFFPHWTFTQIFSFNIWS